MQPRSEEILTHQAATVGPFLVRQVLQQYGAVRLRAFGSSMWPAIQPGAILDIRRASLTVVAPGDIVLFEREGRLFVHRVVRRDGARLRTRGDAHWRADPPVGASHLLGIVTSVSYDGVAASPSHRRPRPAVLCAVLDALRRRLAPR